MSKHAEADLILKLYELRRDPTMREARDWVFREFNPESLADFEKAMFGPHSAHLRMVSSYWDMAAALVNHGAISLELFTDTNGEYFGIFAKVEPLLAEIRSAYGPQYMTSLEKLIDAIPGGRERSVMMRERMKEMRARIAAAQSQAAGKS